MKIVLIFQPAMELMTPGMGLVSSHGKAESQGTDLEAHFSPFKRMAKDFNVFNVFKSCAGFFMAPLLGPQ